MDKYTKLVGVYISNHSANQEGKLSVDESGQVAQFPRFLINLVIQNRLQGWTSGFLSYGGRITLVKSVLSTMPLHYMQAVKISTGIIKHIDRLCQNFLLKGHETCKGSIVW